MVESGLLDIAGGISNLASSLTVSAIRSIQTRISERGRAASLDDADFLRAAIFHGIAQNIIERVEQRLNAASTSGSLSGHCYRQKSANPVVTDTREIHCQTQVSD
jgi:hypothetical protein